MQKSVNVFSSVYIFNFGLSKAWVEIRIQKSLNTDMSKALCCMFILKTQRLFQTRIFSFLQTCLRWDVHDIRVGSALLNT
jgi:hypothetical protein